MAVIDIEEHYLATGTHKKYNVTFFSDTIKTTLTHDPDVVSRWICAVESNYSTRRRDLTVGLDVEWRPNFSRYGRNPVATLQLCVDRTCLIYQLIHTTQIPDSLVRFLSNRDTTFVGVGVRKDLEKLSEDYGIGRNAYAVDMGRLAADHYGRPELQNSGLKALARLVLRREVEKLENVTMSRWDERRLSHEQVKYACVDAFVSFEIGRLLNASGFYWRL